MVDVVPILNKTYYESFTNSVPMRGTVADIFTSKEFTIQKNKAILLTVQLPYAPLVKYNWSGFYVGTSIKVDGTWRDLGNSGYNIGMVLNSVRPERYYDSKYIDLIGDNIVSADASYKIIIKLRGGMYTNLGYPTGTINSAVSLINQNATESGNRGIRIDEVADQNAVSIIIQERNR